MGSERDTPRIRIPSESPAAMHFPKLSALAFELLVPLFVSSIALGAAVHKRAAPYFDPALGGGSMLADAGDGFGEPMNVRPPLPRSHLFTRHQLT